MTKEDFRLPHMKLSDTLSMVDFLLSEFGQITRKIIIDNLQVCFDTYHGKYKIEFGYEFMSLSVQTQTLLRQRTYFGSGNLSTVEPELLNMKYRV
jgi:hypothetical protein